MFKHLAIAALLCAAGATASPVRDTIAERVQACLACHADQDRQTSGGYFPRIAGKPPGYLYQQLLHFRDGQRSYPSMNYLLAHLSDDYLREMADYFAALERPYARPAPGAGPAALLGRALVLQGAPARQIPACVSCHGQKLTGALPATPGLLGLPPAYTKAQFGAWRNGTRKGAAARCMAQLSHRLTAAEIAAVADWLAAQPIAADMTPVALASPVDCAVGP